MELLGIFINILIGANLFLALARYNQKKGGTLLETLLMSMLLTPLITLLIIFFKKAKPEKENPTTYKRFNLLIFLVLSSLFVIVSIVSLFK